MSLSCSDTAAPSDRPPLAPPLAPQPHSQSQPQSQPQLVQAMQAVQAVPHDSSSPPRRPATATSAVIRSPMSMAMGQTESPAIAAPHQSYKQQQQQQQQTLSRDTTPLSTTTAAEYAVIEQKQLELRSVVEHRILSLERQLARREDELEALREQLRKTEEDYQFNYDLIADRDGALEEAAVQMQRVYEELRRTKADCASATDRTEVLERERDELRRRLRDTESRCEEAAQRVANEAAAQRTALHEAAERCAAETEAERRRLHEEYLVRLSALDETRAALSAQQQAQQIEQQQVQQKQQQEQRQLLEQHARQLAQQQQQHEEERLADQRQSAALIAELTELRSSAASLSQQLHTRRIEHDEYARRAESELREAQQRVAIASVAVESARQQCAEAQAQCNELTLQAARAERTARETIARESHELDALQRRASDAWAETTQARQQLSATLMEHDRERLALTEQLSTAQRSLREAQREAQQCREECERTARLRHEECERAQAEAARLTRELHASEAAREALDSRVTEPDAHRAVAESLRREKEALTQRVLELERTNAAVREQVAAFATELQNDPIVRGAHEAARRAEALQSELAKEKEEAERLRTALREKELEVARYQKEILREPPAHARLREEYQSAKEAYERMRRGLQERERERERGRRRQSPTSASDFDDLDDDDDDLDLDDNYASEGPQKEKEEKEKDIHRRRRATRAGKKSRSHSGGKGRHVSESVLMREAELWRRKCVQLEQHLRDATQEREGMARELRAVRREAETAVAERQSLVDLNALLKAQLREAYRTAIDFPHPHPRHTTQRQAQAQAQAQTTDLEQSSKRVYDSTGESTVAARSPPLAVDHLLNGAAAAAAAQPVVKSSLDVQRIAALEEEIAAVKAHMAMQRPAARPGTQQLRQQSRHQVQGQQSQSQVQRVSRSVPRREMPATRGPVVQRGATVVRHYGYT